MATYLAECQWTGMEYMVKGEVKASMKNTDVSYLLGLLLLVLKLN
jgi:hypothetical protein